ncbi:hypothetical protein Y032_0344g3075 [Ancylostoma ceylanicum]|uniref:Uncharacterized protein n=1 Tax=Ancylostoma ceylanicum TaxID=53326 RepID=A0A016RYK9_9BILA|nr:hypothetical protein Y032_0344g3075 [Ancylostoma ceylanicum]
MIPDDVPPNHTYLAFNEWYIYNASESVLHKRTNSSALRERIKSIENLEHITSFIRVLDWECALTFGRLYERVAKHFCQTLNAT